MIKENLVSAKEPGAKLNKQEALNKCWFSIIRWNSGKQWASVVSGRNFSSE